MPKEWICWPQSFLQELKKPFGHLGVNCGGSEGKYWDYKASNACFSVTHRSNVCMHTHAEMVVCCWNTMHFELSLLTNCQGNFQWFTICEPHMCSRYILLPRNNWFGCLEIAAIVAGGGRTDVFRRQQQPFEGRKKKMAEWKKNIK